MTRPYRGEEGRASSQSGDQGSWGSRAIESGDFASYRDSIIHDWLRTLTLMAVILVPLFFLLDVFTMPSSLIPRFGLFRLGSTLIALAQAIVVRQTRPGKLDYFQGYLMSIQVGGVIAIMTTYLGGFDSTYYAGLNLVIIGVNLLMPWKAVHTAINILVILCLYVGLNLGTVFDPAELTNNLFFLISTGVLAVSINHVRYRLIQHEFSLLGELKKARDALWSEIELAKRIQTAILPQKPTLSGYEIAVVSIPAKEVGGDYYDVIETEKGGRWVAIGDVSGHGVDSGLIMMMAQTSLMTAIRSVDKLGPAAALETMNKVLKEDITRLGGNHYMTMMALRLEEDKISVAGHHQDFFVYRAATGKAEALATRGTWLGISDDILPFTEVMDIGIEPGDAIMLFTDGATEGTDASGEMLGEGRLLELFASGAGLGAQEALARVLGGVQAFQSSQEDDITILVLRKGPRIARSKRK